MIHLLEPYSPRKPVIAYATMCSKSTKITCRYLRYYLKDMQAIRENERKVKGSDVLLSQTVRNVSMISETQFK